MLLRKPADAAQTFSGAAALGLLTPDLLYNWAVALSQVGETEEAETVLQQISASDMSDQEQAGQLLEWAVAANPGLADAWYELDILDAQGQ